MTTDRPYIEPPPQAKATPNQCETGNPKCGKKARLFAIGWRCQEHSPRATRLKTTEQQ
ncbi:hypothetical protein ACFV3R_25650 [Streptomyces sp. NPDC059740]|uniref:hypothetical protein n=1 Tax=Streptomyces sp. NPDC059740 TaxID=3346926 RepID=UPI0036574ED8